LYWSERRRSAWARCRLTDFTSPEIVMAQQDWVCPHCAHAAHITDEHNIRTGRVALDLPNADGRLITSVVYHTCPNPRCKRATVDIQLYRVKVFPGRVGVTEVRDRVLASRRLLPPNYAKPMPASVPAAIREDYEEACAIADVSPKAAATLARRALQGMTRDFHKIVRGRLKDEVDALQGVVDPLTWDAIDAVRSVGNIGAHMEKDINTIVEVEPEEALKLIGLIEILATDWYAVREQRIARLTGIVEIGKEKEAKRIAPSPPDVAGTGSGGG
jgi:hypothetical protein